MDKHHRSIRSYMASGVRRREPDYESEVQMTSQQRSSWLERARQFGPTIEKYCDQAEQQRRLPLEVLQALKDEGFLDLMLPVSLGGAQVSLEESLEVFEEFARLDGAIAW